MVKKKEILLFKDEEGNKLFKKYIKSRKIWQMYGKNKEGKLLSASAINSLIATAGYRYNKPVTKDDSVERRLIKKGWTF